MRTTRNIDQKDRLRAILAYDEGHDVRDIADILKISDSTTYNYINDYLRQNKIAHSPRGGSDSKLTVSQEIELISHLYATTYLTAKTICAYVFNKYQIKYTTPGITKWLERNDFVYKQPALIPGKLNEETRQQFITYYQKLIDNISYNEMVMFMDAVHPQYQSQAVCGWIPKDKTKTLATTNAQFRLHLNGTVNLNSMQIVTREYKTIDSESIFHSVLNLNSYTHKKSFILFVITVDLKSSRVLIHYLPPYLPNLNPIE